jgi:putative copper resistance protein D
MTLTLAMAAYGHLAASLVLFGAALFRVYGGASAPQRVLLWSAAAALVFGIAATALHLQAFEATPSQMLNTGLGRIWFAQCGLATALAALTARKGAPGAIAALAAFNLALFGLVGHANAIAGWTGAATEALHLLAAGGWIGGLVALLLRLRTAPSVEMVRRFSRAGLGFVLVLAASGSATLFQITGAPLPMIAFDYGLIAWGKVTLFACTLALAAFNSAVATPRGAWRALTVSIVLELAVLGGALTLAVRLAGTEPLV